MKMAATSGDRSDDELNDTFGELNLQPRRLAVRRHPSSGLQDAIQHGRCLPANPGRDGKPRWKYIHRGTVFVTDESSRHELFSWPLQQDNGAFINIPQAGVDDNFCIHVVVVVDGSGSMRKSDVVGFQSRSEAVLEVLKRDFFEPQLDRIPVGHDSMPNMMVSLICMRDEATVILERAKVSADLDRKLSRCSDQLHGKSHGNYLPALEQVKNLLIEDAENGITGPILLIFLSDGAPSDHNLRVCEHGVQVWQSNGLINRNGKHQLHQCEASSICRATIKRVVENECCERVQKLGDMFGRDRVQLYTVAFGPASEDFAMLQKMANILEGSFQKLGLSASQLMTTFSSLTTHLTSLLPSRMTMRTDKKAQTASIDTFDEKDGWHIYVGQNVAYKRQYAGDDTWLNVPLTAGAVGVAMTAEYFLGGAERLVFHCREISEPNAGKYTAVGLQMVAKETNYVEQLQNAQFHKEVAIAQAEAQRLALRFNKRLELIMDGDQYQAAQVSFVDCFIYEVIDRTYEVGKAWILAEPYLDGIFQKWNNNAGKVKSEFAVKCDDQLVAEAPQAFSHYTHSITDGDMLVCDLQGVWNTVDGYRLTDPVVHRQRRRDAERKTDKGLSGMKDFFKTHECGPLCQKLGLVKPEIFSL